MLTDPVSFYVASLLLGAAGGGGVAWFVERRHAGKAPAHSSVAPMTGTEAHGVMAAIDGMASALVHHTAATKANTATVAEAVAAQKARIAADADKIEPRLAPPPAEPAARVQPDMPVEMLAPFAPPKQSDADRMEAAATRQEAMLAAMQALHERMTELTLPQPVPAATPALTMTVANPSPATALAIAAGPAAA